MLAILHNKRLKTISRRHPWVFSGAIRRFSGAPGPGDIVTLATEDEQFLARGIWNPQSSIRLRVLTWEDEPIDDAFWRRRLQAAIARRGKRTPDGARRLINAENDYLPGLIVDQYGPWLVLQAGAAGIDQRKVMLAEMLAEMLSPSGVYERSDHHGRGREGLPPATGVLWGEQPPPLVQITEDEFRFPVDIRQGHKTGFYLDQCENRRLLGDLVLPGNRVLNAFSYTGAFAAYAYSAGAEAVLSVDISSDALALAEEQLAANGFTDVPLLQGDVFEVLRDLRDEGEQFDIVVLDPPKFAKTPNEVDGALRGYKDINMLGFDLVRPGGYVMTFSCSGLVSTDLFRKVVFGALEDVGREAQVLRQLSAPPDHPVALTFPEGQYLKGLLCRVL
ncbi:MAG: class I SAM-dependent rRNA methyltransferase [Anaerolineales bacterium]